MKTEEEIKSALEALKNMHKASGRNRQIGARFGRYAAALTWVLDDFAGTSSPFDDLLAIIAVRMEDKS